VPAAIEFRLTAVLERVRDDGPAVLPADTLHSPRLLRPTRLTAPDERLRAMAAALAGSGDPTELAQRICAAVSSAITYEYGVTTVSTTAAEALACGRGVCQDSAHVMLALCRLLGQPARYVSGHLLGQGGTHAWVEVIVPSGDHAEAIAFDPCNGRRTDGGYVTIATGRDYRDVAPTSGRYSGASSGRLTAARRVGVLAAALPEIFPYRNIAWRKYGLTGTRPPPPYRPRPPRRDLHHLDPAAASTASNAPVNCPARSRTRNRNWAARSQVHQQRRTPQ